jgi:hypothetical protein
MEEDEIITKISRCKSNFIAIFIMFLHECFQKKPNIKFESVINDFSKHNIYGVRVSENTVYKTINLFIKYELLYKIWLNEVFLVPNLETNGKPKLNKYLKYALKKRNIDEKEYFLGNNKKLIDFKEGG